MQATKDEAEAQVDLSEDASEPPAAEQEMADEAVENEPLSAADDETKAEYKNEAIIL